MISQIIYNLHPTQYRTTIALIKRDINKGVEITLQDVEDDIRQIYGSIKNPQASKEESALVTKPGFKKQFKSICRICGGRHRAADCWELPKNKANRSLKFKPTAFKRKEIKPSQFGETANIGVPYSGPPCSYCKMTNHPVERCYKKRDDEKAKNDGHKNNNKSNQKEPFTKREGMMICVTKEEVETLMSTTMGSSRFTANTFIADSGATCHMRNSTSGMYDLEDHIQEITVGNGDITLSKYRGKFRGTIIQQDGGYMDIVLHDVLFVPDLYLNLLSLTKALKHPHIKLQSDGELITVLFTDLVDENGQQEKMVFDKIYPTGSGQLLGVEIQPCEDYANMVMLTEALTRYEDLHEKLGHPNDTVVTKTASHYDIKVRDKQGKCRFCAMGKQHRLPIPRNVSNLSSTRGERINIDISSVAAASFGGAKFWLLIQDDYTDFIWSYFLKTKAQMANTFMSWLTTIEKETKLTIRKIRCDNSGENRSLQELVRHDHNLSVKFEFTAPYTPQQNGKIERKFATLYGKIRAMLNWARLTPHLRKRLWAQCANTATKLENIIVKNESRFTSYELFYGTNPEWAYFLRTFGEIGIVQDGRLGHIKGKLTNRGIPCMFIGYPDDHAPNVYQFLKLESETMILSRNVTWMNQSYGEYKKLKIKVIEVQDHLKTIEDFEIMDLYDLDPNENEHIRNDDDDAEEGIEIIMPWEVRDTDIIIEDDDLEEDQKQMIKTIFNQMNLKVVTI